MKFTIVKLMGGLGNQMFQYAFALGHAARTGRQILFDTHFFDTQSSTVLARREYALDIFPNITPQFADAKLVHKIRHPGIFNWYLYCHLNEDKMTNFFARAISDKHMYQYLSGYYQNEKHFDNVANDVRNAFTFPEFARNDKYNMEIINHIHASKNPVFIHVRRGDYMNLDGWTLGIEYYKRAVKHILCNVPDAEFFVFASDCDNYIRDSFDIGVPFTYIGNGNTKTGNDFRDMQLMSMCKHGIIANSSFSWWAAWLIQNPHKIICAPNPWINDIPSPVCDNWIKIDRPM